MQTGPTSQEGGYRIEVIDRPSELDHDRSVSLAQAFTQLSAQATGGPDWKTYRPGFDGWRDYYDSKGGRPHDYDRLVLAWFGRDLVHFSGAKVVSIPKGVTLVWFQIAITDPHHQSGGLLLRAIDSLLAAPWLRTLEGDLFAVFRTPNPIVYEAMRAVARAPFSGWRIKEWYPQITGPDSIAPVPPAVADLARRIASTLSPDRPFKPATFVIDGYFKEYGPLYKTLEFPCRNEATKAFFARNLDDSNQDGLMTLVRIELT